MAAVCVHGFPTPAACVTCMEDGVFVPGQFPDSRTHRTVTVDLDDVTVLHTLTAQYPGRCVLCREGIVVGEQIAALDTDPTSYAHEDCVPGGARPAPWAAGGEDT